jgi:predicted DNA-binding WGR domain protein
LKLVRQTRLHCQEGNSDKIYEVDLCEAGEDGFLVNFRYGRRGSTLREGTKTAFPMSRAKAEGVFDKLVAEKMRGGYQVIGSQGGGPPLPAAASVAVPAATDPRRSAVLKRLAGEAAGRPPVRARWKLSRVIWRAGAWRMREAADAIAAMVPSLKTEMDFWCAAWALGRCGEAKHAVALDVIAERVRSVPWVGAMVAEARAALLPDEPPTLGFEGPLREAVEAENADTVRELAEREMRAGKLDAAGQRDLMLLAARLPWMRGVIHELVATVPVEPGTISFFRQVLKSSEFRLDAELYGRVMRRIERAPGNPVQYWRPKGAPRTVFTTTTRNYFRRRMVKHLRVLGESGDPSLFIPLATGVLVAFDDAIDEPSERSTVAYGWDPQTRRTTFRTRWYPRYADRLGFLWLLRGAGSTLEMNLQKTGWRCVGEGRGDAVAREEPFAELWDQAPDAVMHLLRHARSEEVQRFALRVWRDNPAFLDEADEGLVRDLLGSWYPETVVLGLEVARAKWDPAAPDAALLLAMLDASLDEARGQGLAWLRESAATMAESADFLSGVAFLAHEDARVGAREVLRARPLSPAVRDEVVARVVSGLLALDDEGPAGAAADWLEFIAGEMISKLRDEHVADLASHPLEACQLLAVRILLKRASPGQLPEPLLTAALSSEHASVRRLGMELLAKLDDDGLARRVETLAACAVSRHPELREVAAPLLKRAASRDRAAARGLVAQWWSLLFRKEEFEGLHASVHEALTTSFADDLDAIPPGTWREMLRSKYGHGQELGFELLKREVGQPGFDDLIEWAVHPLAALRGWACGHFDAGDLRGDPARMLKLLEGPYDDSREWAFGFCRTQLQDGDWSPEALVAVCDSNHEATRDFGRELVTRLFREEDGPLYLARLSQHPSTGVQVFATNYLERFASGEPERIEALELYFRTVLSRIGAGRVAKRRVLAFLEKEALADGRVARFANGVLGRQAGTVAIQDKAETIRVLDALRRKWPELGSPLKPVSMEVNAGS